MEARLAEAVFTMQTISGSKIGAVAKEFGVSRHQLRRRLNGIGPLKGSHKGQTLLTPGEEDAIAIT